MFSVIGQIRRRLCEQKLFGRRPAKKPFLSKRNIKAGLDFALELRNQIVDQLLRMIFIADSMFNPFKSKFSDYVRWPQGKTFNSKYASPPMGDSLLRGDVCRGMEWVHFIELREIRRKICHCYNKFQ